MITPASKVEGQKNGHSMLGKGDVIVEAAHLSLNITILGSVGVLLNVGAEIITVGREN